MDALSSAERLALGEFAEWVRGRFGARVRQLTLFGSRARGEGDAESDLDVLVLVDGMTSAEGREIAGRAGDALTHHDVLVSALALASTHYDLMTERERLLPREVARDGVPL